MSYKIITLIVLTLLSGCFNDNQTQMVICSVDNDIECIKKYLSNGHSPNGLGKENTSPFYAALRNHNFEIANLFIKYGADLNSKSGGHTYIFNLIEESDIKSLSYLKNAGAKFKKNSEEYRLAIKKEDPVYLSYFEKNKVK